MAGDWEEGSLSWSPASGEGRGGTATAAVTYRGRTEEGVECSGPSPAARIHRAVKGGLRFSPRTRPGLSLAQTYASPKKHYCSLLSYANEDELPRVY